MLHGVKIIILLFLCTRACSQSFVYQPDYFRWPVGNKPAIVANFGELRSDHWHMGLDVRTDQKVNMPVYAVAAGYIAKVSVHPSGYGQAIYINHPNGLTTVYGHLNKFFPVMDSLVRAEQYRRESWDIELEFRPDQFRVVRGQFIANSGSTGASQGPHVHFEIRNTFTSRCINPFFFDLPVPDATAPVFTRLAIYDRSISVYDQKPGFLPITKTKAAYSARDGLIRTALTRLSVAIGAYDCVDHSTNQNGIYGASLSVDGKVLIGFALDSMDYYETGFVNAHIDYRYRYNGGSYLQHLSRLPGNDGRAYRPAGSDGIIDLTDTSVHTVRIMIEDARRNRAELTFRIQHIDGRSAVREPRRYFAPNFVNVFEQPGFELYLPEHALYDSIQPVFFAINPTDPNAASLLFRFSSPSIPIQVPVRVRIHPAVPVNDSNRGRMVIRRSDEKGTNFRKAEWQQDWLAAAFDDFGSYQALIDNTPPTLSGWKGSDTADLSAAGNIIFYPADNSGIRSFRAELDGRWLRFTNDKGRAWIYDFDDHCPFGLHELVVRVEDIAGNQIEKNYWFKRNPYSAPKKPRKFASRKRTKRDKRE
jgi:murein DD-endopeptidase MepM/ murein hydrolase activator NlpD